jgi:hypothetical protein
VSIRDEVDRFTLTANHVKLLRAANVGWDHVEFGAPAIDGKRPYGNGDVYDDMATLLGMAVECPNCSTNVLGDNDRAKLRALHESTKTALQVVLSSGSFEPGEYVSPKYGHNWRRAK